MKGQGLPWLKEILKLPFSSIYLIWFKRTSEEILTAGNPKFWYIFFFSQNWNCIFKYLYPCTIQIRGYAHYFHELSSLETRRNFLCVYFYQKSLVYLRISNVHFYLDVLEMVIIYQLSFVNYKHLNKILIGSFKDVIRRSWFEKKKIITKEVFPKFFYHLNIKYYCVGLLGYDSLKKTSR